MKKLLLLFVVLNSFLPVFAQPSNAGDEVALNLVRSHANQLQLSKEDLQNLVVSATYQTKEGIRMVYLQQTYRNIPVFNKMLVMAFRGGQLLSNSGSIQPFMSQVVNNKMAAPLIRAEDAVAAAMADQKLVPAQPVSGTMTGNGRISFGKLGVSSTDIKAELVWLPVSDKEVKLTWQVEIAPVKTPDHWLLRIDAADAKVLDRNNYTVHEHFETDHADNSLVQEGRSAQAALNSIIDDGPEVVSSAGYRVIQYPVESPNHTGGAATLVTDPWTAASGNATSLQWHYDGTIYHDSTRGNNVWAQEDRDNSNTTFGKTAISTTAQPALTFDFTPNYTQAPTVTVNQQFATTNLFYWNNIIHDITYLYGFDEVAGNFQSNNQGRGGAGNDYVIADAQDAGGTNNANFSTPTDGNRPRMQMYLFTSTTPNRDGDLDNGIIVHEYGHGVSNRLTGGPTNTSCLSNAEQGGEGWSDYLALMLTTNWATATVADGTLSRPMGTYALGQATTAAGIRTYPYSTNMAVNPWTYGMLAGTGGQVHRIGEIWCTALWEMTWEMIAVDGINPNLYNYNTTGGNSAALKLVIEGMRLQPCSPGYIDARNAILKADTLFFGAKYSCAIWKAFAKRGMGKLASQGSSNSTTDQVEDFTNNGSSSLLLTQSVIQQQEGLFVTYTNRVSAGSCGALLNHTLRDTLPANVTYVSGGSYNAGTRVVSFPVNIAVGQSQDYTFTVQINPGSYYAPVLLLDENIAGTSIPASLTTSSTTSTNWAVSSAQSTSAPNSLFSLNIITTSDQIIQTTNTITLPANPPKLTFQGYINAEPTWDGGVVEISTDGGSTWTDLGSRMISGGYNGSLSSSGANPIRGRSAFTGNSNGFVKTTIDLASYAGQSVKFRFRFGSDASVAAVGWYVDDILLKDIAQVNMRSGLFNNSNLRVAISDTFTLILPGLNCDAGVIGTQPLPQAVCAGSDASFSIAATGTDLTYQWQVSTDNGVSFTNIPGETGTNLNLVAVTGSLNGNLYRCVINGTCTTNLESDNVLLTVNALPVLPAAVNGNVCGSGSTTVSVVVAPGETADWYDAPAVGNLLQSNSTFYITGTLNSSTTYYVVAKNIATGCLSSGRTPVTAVVNALPSAPVAVNGYTCGTGQVTVSASAGLNETIDWYDAASGGSLLQSGTSSFTTGTISSTITIYAVARNINTGCISANSTAVLAEIRNNSSSSTAISICSNQLPFTWNNQIFNAGGVYSVTLSNASGCDSVATLLLDVAAELTTFDVTGGGSYTIGGAGVPVGLSGSQPGVQYQLILDGVGNIGSPVTGTGSAISFGNQLEEGAYYVVAAPTALCPKDMNGSVMITITSAPPAAFQVTGGGTYCAGSGGIAIGLAGSETGVSYQLQRAGGTINVGSPLAGTGSALSFGLQSTSDTYSVLATNTTSLLQQSMLNSVFVRMASLRNPSSPGAITGPSDACPLIGNGTAVYTIRQAANATSYIWTAPAGASIIGSNTDTMVTVQYSSNFVPGYLSVQSVNGCFNNAVSSIRSLAITKRIPGTPGSITSSSPNVCAAIGNGMTVVYTIRKVTYATSYNWSVSAGMNIVANQGDTGIVVSFNAGYTTGSVSVTAQNNCAVSAARTLAVTASAPSAPGAISGPSNVCTFIGQPATAIYTINAVNGAGSYLWTVPANASIVSGQGTTSLELSFAANFTGGTLSVRSVAACGNSSARSLALVKNVARPGVISASDIACPLSTVTYSIAAVPFATSYIWSVPTNATYVSGQGTTSFTVTYKAAFVSGTVTVKSVNNCSTSAVSSLAVNNSSCPAPRVPATSAELLITGTNLYPNPSNGIFTAVLKASPDNGAVKLQLFDMYGKLVLTQRENVNKNGSINARINASYLPAGIYELRCISAGKIEVMKVVISK